MRECGILLPITSIPSPYGIGGFSKEAYEFIDQLKEAGQQYWQVLPFGPTGYGDSPYQSFSAFAGNPYFIDLDTLAEEGLLTEKECREADCGQYPAYVDYERIYRTRFAVLRKAYERWKQVRKDHEEDKLRPETKEYCFYMAVKNHFQGKSWTEWEEDIRLRKPEAVAEYENLLKDEIDFYRFQQLKFQEQWDALKAYANQNGIRIIGDIPIYVALDSADSWFHPELFQFNEEREPDFVAGCPPDGFSPTGQLWGNPLYRWEYHRKTGYAWWCQRMSYCFQLCDVVRVDHFRGFDEYYAIPAEDETAAGGHWEKGPGLELFCAIEKKLGKLDIIAEDLGFLTPSVLKMVKDSGFPGMKVLEFAFSADGESIYLPYHYDENCVVYTGTHDNDTLQSWYGSMPSWDRDFSVRYLGNGHTPPEEIHWDFIRAALGSRARLAVIPMQDYLGLGREARMNEPSTLGDNWKWRLVPGQFDKRTREKCRDLAWIYGRRKKNR